uniref:Uncharacterized protein n=1 Tax=Micrurus spixii TaxID=129469 RepID=A0A2D4LX64_9SAUR
MCPLSSQRSLWVRATRTHRDGRVRVDPQGEQSLNRGGSYNRLFACRGGCAPDAHLRVWGRGTLSVPESLGVWKLPKASWGAQHSGTGEPRQMYVSCCELC